MSQSSQQTPPEKADEIVERVYLGGEWSSKNLSHLRDELKITHVLTVANGLPPPFPEHFKYKVVPIYDMETVDLLVHFQQCHQFIDGAIAEGGSILVHCHAGASRSATVVISYLMKTLSLGWEKAMNFAVARRPVVCPNYGFLLQLQRYEELLKSPSSLASYTSAPSISDSDSISYWYSTSTPLFSAENESEEKKKKRFFHLPKNKKGHHPSFSLAGSGEQKKRVEEEIRAFFKKYGFVVIRGVVPPNLIENVIDDIWDNFLLPNKDPRALRNDPSTWHYLFPPPPPPPPPPPEKSDERKGDLTQEELWTMKVFKSGYNTTRGFLGHDFTSSQASWNIRQNPTLYEAFSTILEEQLLTVTLDRYGLMRPTKLRRPKEEGGFLIEEHPEWKTQDRWVHWDQNPWTHPDFVGVQGLVTLSDHNEGSGGFHCIPGFVHEFKEWGQRNLSLKSNSSLVDFPKNDPSLVEGDRLLRLCMPKGSLLIWDSRTPHGNYPNEGFDWRMVMYVTMKKDDGVEDSFTKRMRELLTERTNGMEITGLGRLLIGLGSWVDEGHLVL